MLFPLYGRRESVRLALGLHPLEVAKVDLAKELALFRGYAAHTSYIGEIGLDYSRDGKPSRAIQEEALDAILDTQGVAGKVLSVHSRSASTATVERLRIAKATRVILHWFSGSMADLDAGLDAGFYFSVNPAMTRSEKGRKIIARLPKDRTLVESDGPYARLAGRQLEPRDVAIAVAYLDKIWDGSPADAARQLSLNLRRLCDGLPTAVSNAASGLL
jgi:TatD DNase family protein